MQKRRRFAGQYSDRQIRILILIRLDSGNQTFLPKRAKAVIRVVKSGGYRVFLLALILSLIWHIFWLSVIKVVAASEPKSSVKFSRVSFLGPILTKDNAGLRVEPKKLSFLEKHYFKTIEILINTDIDSGRSLRDPRDYMPDSGSRPPGEDVMASLVDKAISGQKLEPGYAADRRRFGDMARP